MTYKEGPEAQRGLSSHSSQKGKQTFLSSRRCLIHSSSSHYGCARLDPEDARGSRTWAGQ